MINYRYIALLTLGLLTACQQEQPKKEPITPPTPSVPAEKPNIPSEDKQVVSLSLTAQPEAAFRLAQIVDEATGKVVIPFLRERNLLVRLAIRSTTGVEYKTVVFTKEVGVLRASYKEELNLPQSVSQVDVAAIVLGEVADATNQIPAQQFAKVPSEEDGKKHLVQAIPTPSSLLPIEQEGGQSIVKTTLPYVSEWRTIQLEAGKDNHVDLLFKPSAALICMRLENKQSVACQIKSVQIKTTAFVRAWSYDFTKLGVKTTTSSNTLLAGERVDATSPAVEDQFELRLPQELTLQPNTKSSWFYFWAMPVSATVPVSTEITLTAVSLKDPRQEEKLISWKADHQFKIGATPIEVKIKPEKTPPTPPPVSTPEMDYSVSVRRGQTWFMRGVNTSASSPTTWKPIYSGLDMKGLRWEKQKNYGWYDVNKEDPSPRGGDSDLCWAAVAANTLQWWLDQNKVYVDRYDRERKIPRNFESPFKSDIFELYKNSFANKGGDLKTSFDWFFNGKYGNLDGSASLQNWPGAGFFKEVFTKDVFSDAERSKRFIGEDFRPVEQIGFSVENFSDEVAKALRLGEGLSCVVRYPNGYLHALSIWGVDFDEQGRVSHIYLTDSNDRDIDEPSNETQYTTRAGLVRKAIYYRKSGEFVSSRYMPVGVYHESSAKGVFNFQIQTLCKLPLLQKEWEAYFKKKEQKP